MNTYGPILKIVGYLSLVALTVYLLLKLLAPFSDAILLALVVALVTRPLFAKLKKRGLNQTLASLVITVFSIIVVVGPISTFAVLTIRDAKTYLDRSDELAPQTFLLETAKKVASALPATISEQINWGDLQRQLNSAAKQVLAFVLGIMSSLPNTLIQLALATLTLFFLLRDGPVLFRWLSGLVPLDSKVLSTLSKTTYESTVASVAASFWTATVISVLILIAFLSLSIPGAFLAAGVVFIFSWIPMLGAAPVWLIGLIYLASQGLWTKFAIMCAIAALISVSDNITRMYVFKGRNLLHPMLGLLAVLGGINVFGMMGIVVGPIVATVAIALLKIAPEVLRKFNEERHSLVKPISLTDGGV